MTNSGTKHGTQPRSALSPLLSCPKKNINLAVRSSQVCRLQMWSSLLQMDYYLLADSGWFDNWSWQTWLTPGQILSYTNYTESLLVFQPNKLYKTIRVKYSNISSWWSSISFINLILHYDWSFIWLVRTQWSQSCLCLQQLILTKSPSDQRGVTTYKVPSARRTKALTWPLFKSIICWRPGLIFRSGIINTFCSGGKKANPVFEKKI